MAKFVYVSPRQDLTGLNADEWLSVRPGTEAAVALAMANAVATARGAALPAGLAKMTPAAAAQETGVPAERIERIAREFAAAAPSLAVAGGVGSQHAGATQLCAAVNLLNFVAGNIGKTVKFGADLAAADGYGALGDLTKAIDGGQVALLVVHDANPVYALPKASGFADRLKKVAVQGLDLALPRRDRRPVRPPAAAEPRARAVGRSRASHRGAEPDAARDGAGIRHPRRGGHPPAGRQEGGRRAGQVHGPSWEAHLRSRWESLAGERKAGDAGEFWRSALQRGGLFDEASAAAEVALAPSASELGYTKPAFEGKGEFVLLVYPHGMLHDGRGTNKPWLLENADPVTKITWHHWVEVGPETARRLDIRNGEILRLTSPHGAVEGPAYIHPGLHAEAVGMPLGFGHTAYGAFAEGRGANALDLLGAPAGDFLPYVSTRVTLEKTGGFRRLATIEGVPRQLGRGIAEAMPLAAAKKGLTVKQAYLEEGHGEHEVNTELEVEALKGWSETQHQMTLKGDYAREHPQWGMAIDLARCTGCQACVTACYAENNIPTVGEQEVLRGREMTWIRIERYWEGGEADGEGAQARFVPMLCQHCANAPCEPVCPVYAAYHTADGLNGQVYNRCVGTRYCANNCPYKVRYFNWYKYNDLAWPEPLHLQLNPDVTVRARGVMEKCTFCVQRIRGAQNQARLEESCGAGRRVHHRLRPGLSVRRDRLRRRQEPGEPRRRDQAGPPGLSRPGRDQRPAGDHLPRQGPAFGGGLTKWLSSHVPVPPGSPSWSSPRLTRTSPVTSSRPWRSPPPATSCCCWARLRCSWWGC